MAEVDVLVVGAGPAGLAAACTAAEAGARVLVVDESSIVGGQYLRPRPPGRVAHPIVTRFLASGAEVLADTSVWHVDTDAQRVRAGGEVVSYRGLVIATGAFDRPFAVAGGDLPGVVTAGAAQALAKDGVRLGSAVLIAGTGPFALPVAAELTRAGSGVTEIALTRLPWLGSAVVHAPEVVPEAARYARVLARARIALRGGWVLREVRGDGRVECAVLAGLPGGPRAGRRREVECDAVALGYGFLPQLAVADLTGCRLRFDPGQRTWFVAVDDRLATSVAGVFAAGEVTAIGGHRKAVADGLRAGSAAALHAGFAPAATGRQRRLARFASAAQPALAPPPLAGAVADEAVVCRCEGVSAGDVRAAARDGATTVPGVRMRTRCGMGPCQGRMCAQLASELVDVVHDAPAGTAGRLVSRLPARPVMVGELGS